MASWKDWGFIPMLQTLENPDIYSTKMTMQSECIESFRIVIDQDPSQAFHPEMKAAPLHSSRALGPDDEGKELYWSIVATPGSEVMITLDFTQRDKRMMVSWTEDAEAIRKLCLL